MSQINDTRFFLIPAFQLDQSGTIHFYGQHFRPELNRIFECEATLLQHTDIKWLPKRDSSEAFSLLSPPGSLIYLSSWKQRMPIFWRGELFDKVASDLASEVTYTELLVKQREFNLLYVSFSQQKKSVRLSARGRLIEVLLYIALLDTDGEKVSKFTDVLNRQNLREPLFRNSQEFMSIVDVQLDDERGSYCQGLLNKYPIVGGVLKLLL